MKEVIKHGSPVKYHDICCKCHCEFTYENDDIDSSRHVTCPDCGMPLPHPPGKPTYTGGISDEL